MRASITDPESDSRFAIIDFTMQIIFIRKID